MQGSFTGFDLDVESFVIAKGWHLLGRVKLVLTCYILKQVNFLMHRSHPPGFYVYTQLDIVLKWIT